MSTALEITMLTPGRTAPVLSVTVPLMTPVMAPTVWPAASARHGSRRASASLDEAEHSRAPVDACSAKDAKRDEEDSPPISFVSVLSVERRSQPAHGFNREERGAQFTTNGSGIVV